MRHLFLVSLLAISAICTDLPYKEFPTFKIDLDLPESVRFVEMTTALKPQIIKMMDDYLHLAPRFLRNFFKDNEEVIKLRHLDIYAEIVSIAEIVELDTSLVLMLNYAFELHQALCTSIVARTPSGKIIHGRNMDFGFADAVRNATYIGQFYQNGVHLFDSVMFGGYQGVATAYVENSFSMSLNARGGGGEKGSIEQYFRIMGLIYSGLPEIGVATREAMIACAGFDCFQEQMLAIETIVPMYVIIAGIEENQGVVISKAELGADNIQYLDEDHWYIVQTNDDHFAGVCQERCQDAIAHMDGIGKDNISLETLLDDVITQAHNLNVHTIYTTMSSPSENIWNAYGFNSDTPYVK